VRSRYWELYVLAGLFLSPVICALYVHTHLEQFKLRTIQHGTLISQPISIEPLLVKTNKWQILYVNVDHQPILTNLHKALGADQERVRLQIVSNNVASYIGQQNAEIMIVNPMGLVIMHYDADANISGILKDMKRLLKYSHA